MIARWETKRFAPLMREILDRSNFTFSGANISPNWTTLEVMARNNKSPKNGASNNPRSADIFANVRRK